MLDFIVYAAEAVCREAFIINNQQINDLKIKCVSQKMSVYLRYRNVV